MKKGMFLKIFMGLALVGLIIASLSIQGMAPVARVGRQAVVRGGNALQFFPSLLSPKFHIRLFNDKPTATRTIKNVEHEKVSAFPTGAQNDALDTADLSDLVYFPVKKKVYKSNRAEIVGDQAATVEEQQRVGPDTHATIVIDPSVLDSMYQLQQRMTPELHQFLKQNTALYAPLVLKVREGAVQSFVKKQPKTSTTISVIDAQGNKPIMLIGSEQVAEAVTNAARPARQLLEQAKQAPAPQRGRPTNMQRQEQELLRDQFADALQHGDRLMLDPLERDVWSTLRRRLEKEGRQQKLISKPMGPQKLRKPGQKKPVQEKISDVQAPEASHVPQQEIQPIRGSVPDLPEHTQHTTRIRERVLPEPKQAQPVSNPKPKELSVKYDVPEPTQEGQLKRMDLSQRAEEFEVRSTDIPEARVSFVREAPRPVLVEEGNAVVPQKSGVGHTQSVSMPQQEMSVQTGIMPEYPEVGSSMHPQPQETLLRQAPKASIDNALMVHQIKPARGPAPRRGLLRESNKSLTTQALWPTWKPGPTIQSSVDHRFSPKGVVSQLRKSSPAVLPAPHVFRSVYPKMPVVRMSKNEPVPVAKEVVPQAPKVPQVVEPVTQPLVVETGQVPNLGTLAIGRSREAESHEATELRRLDTAPVPTNVSTLHPVPAAPVVPAEPPITGVLQGTAPRGQADDPAVPESTGSRENEDAKRNREQEVKNEQESKAKEELEQKEQKEKKEHAEQEQKRAEPKGSEPWSFKYWLKWPYKKRLSYKPVPKRVKPKDQPKSYVPWWLVPSWKQLIKWPIPPDPVPSPLPNNTIDAVRGVPSVLAPANRSSMSVLPAAQENHSQEDWKDVALVYDKLAQEVLERLKEDIVYLEASSNSQPLRRQQRPSGVSAVSFDQVRYKEVKEALTRYQKEYDAIYVSRGSLNTMIAKAIEIAQYLKKLAEQTFYIREKVAPKKEAAHAAQ